MLKALTIFLFLVECALPFNRIVILAPAASDILLKLGVPDNIVKGRTKHIEDYPSAISVGTHLKPNIELMMELQPDLIITMNSNFFLKHTEQYFKTTTYIYDPLSLNEIIINIKELASMFGSQVKSQKLIKHLKEKLNHISPVNQRPTVLFEISSNPLIFSGKSSIIYDIIEKAGGYCPLKENKKFVKASIETIYKYSPDIYIYQVGPMNKNPVPPENRKYFHMIKKPVFLKVKEGDFTRANTRSFTNAVMLNKFFKKAGF
jgi:iron complex transport system substrate-binding protein